MAQCNNIIVGQRQESLVRSVLIDIHTHGFIHTVFEYAECVEDVHCKKYQSFKNLGSYNSRES